MSDFEPDTTNGNTPAPPRFAPPGAAGEEGGTQGEMTRSALIRSRVTGWWRQLGGKLKRPELTSSQLRNMDIRNMAEWAQNSLQGHSYAFYGRLLTAAVSAYFLADVAAIVAGGHIPEPPLSRPVRSAALLARSRTLEAYNNIFTRNLFNRKGIIPGDDVGGDDVGGDLEKTTLPFNLIGTLILRDSSRSIATIEDTSAKEVYPVRVDDEIPGKARIVKVEPTRAIFVNLSSQRREYVDLPDDTNTTNPRVQVGKAAGGGIEQVGSNQYAIDRNEVNKAFSNLSGILTQARALPNIENGVPNGFKLTQIVPGSIYSKLGLKDNDVVMGVDGSPINDPMKAMELLNHLREQSHVEIQVKHDGRTQTYAYDIH